MSDEGHGSGCPECVISGYSDSGPTYRHVPREERLDTPEAVAKRLADVLGRADD